MSPAALFDDAAERRRAARALLAQPLLTQAAEEFRLVRKHAAELAAWFSAEAGWRLVVETETARLVKTPAAKAVPSPLDATRPALAVRSKAPFTRRRYVLLCLALASLERADAQITLGRLAEGVLTGAGDPALVAAGIEFRMERREERGDLVAVVRLLLHWRVLHRVAGDEEAYVADTQNDVLYDVDRRVLSSLLATTRGPSTVRVEGGAGVERPGGGGPALFERRLAALTEEVLPETDELRLRSLRHRMTRRLLDDPVVYYEELSEEERAYLVSQRIALSRRIGEFTGLVPELRAEGVAMVDPEDQLTDVRMPEQGTDGHVTLLIATRLADAAAGGERPPTHAELVRHIRLQSAAHAAHWRKTALEPSAATDLVDQALDRLAALNLITRAGAADGEQSIAARPAIARYALAAPTIRKAGPRR
jgi:uncharacterized protein (TIGR02678 family)